MNTYVLYADGSCSGNPGPGGWAYELCLPDTESNPLLVCSGGAVNTTNNRMELEAAINAFTAMLELEGVLPSPGHVEMRLDSKYVLDGLFSYMPNWVANGWKTSSRKPVKNAELWQKLEKLHSTACSRGFSFAPAWVKGHNGEPGNERVDSAAQYQTARYAQMVTHEPEAARKEMQNAPSPESGQQPVPQTSPDAIAKMRAILDRYTSGDSSVKQVMEEIRTNATALGLLPV